MKMRLRPGRTSARWAWVLRQSPPLTSKNDIVRPMSRIFLIRSTAAALVLAGAWVAYTQQPAAPNPLILNKVKDDLFVIQDNGSGNVAVYLTNEGTIIVDDKFERNYDGIMEKI